MNKNLCEIKIINGLLPFYIRQLPVRRNTMEGGTDKFCNLIFLISNSNLQYSIFKKDVGQCKDISGNWRLKSCSIQTGQSPVLQTVLDHNVNRLKIFFINFLTQ